MTRLLTAALFLCILPFSRKMYVQSFTSSDLPIVVINTNGQDIPYDPKIEADRGIIGDRIIKKMMKSD